MAKARDIPGFADSASFREAAARVVEVRTGEVFEHAEDVLDVTNIERVHDMRVATRRLRAALEIFAVCFPKSEHRKVLKEVKRLSDVLGERRDPDVAIAGFAAVRDGLPQADRTGINHLIDELRARQAGANETLAAAIERMRNEGLHERLLALTAEAQPGVKARKVKRLDPNMPLDAALRRIADTRLDEVHSFERAVHDPGAVEDLHDMRIAAKRLRYVLEMSEPVLGPPASKGAKQAKKLQDLLGEIHDCDEHLPLVEDHLARLRAEDAAAVQACARSNAADLDPAAARGAPHRRHYSGLEALAAYLHARRAVLYRRFVREWTRIEKAGFRASLNGEVS